MLVRKGRKMGIITWIVVGLIAGVLAKLVMPGDDPGGIIMTIILGIVGGFVMNLLGFGGISGFQPIFHRGGRHRSVHTAGDLPHVRRGEKSLRLSLAALSIGAHIEIARVRTGAYSRPCTVIKVNGNYLNSRI